MMGTGMSVNHAGRANVRPGCDSQLTPRLNALPPFSLPLKIEGTMVDISEMEPDSPEKRASARD